METAKRLTGFFVLFSILLILSACNGSSDEVLSTSISVYRGESSGLIYLAQSRGFFAEENLEVEISEFNSGKVAFEEMVAGKTQFSTATSSVFISRHSSAPGTTILSTIATGEINEYITPAESGISSHSDLPGKRIGLTFGTAAEFLLKTDLLLHQIDYRNVELVDMDPDELMENLVLDIIDVAYTWNPNVYNIARDFPGETYILPGQSRNPFYFLLMTKDLEGNDELHEISLRMLRAIKKAEESLRKEPETAREELARILDYTPEYSADSWPQHRFIVELPQSLLFYMENEILWHNDQSPPEEHIEFSLIESFTFSPMEEVKPEGITILH